MYEILKKALDMHGQATVHFQSGAAIAINDISGSFFDEDAIGANGSDGISHYIINLREIEYISFENSD
ncbi:MULTISPECIES: hypothetical protein [unclassified Lactococcus]|uniref:hypothetical protein n=1 Tax=unclassified Lactococcus TaxID=2643510 RepID=UPI0011CAF393|nr:MULTISPECIES: hypothetical protein [unclassified Lactococcus]MQW23904.1 hypothetical protein [Lactococcus sp. dk101]TXK37132.1 hypothetical protein FVP42_09790 [Lactococcus sp. dk310]TXK47986.1 hypothetical protein FVP43_09515 [Lactococcus sp. dk322]